MMSCFPRSLVASTVVLSMSVASTVALANTGGVAGYTGKPTASAPQGESCNQCHSGGTAPQVSLNGPSSLMAGQTSEYTLVVTTSARAAGGVAATDGVVLTPIAGGGLRDSFGELVQNGTTNGTTTYRFNVTAPATGSSIRLWAVGLAAGGSTGTAGDRAMHITRDISVTGGGGSSSSGEEPPPSSSGGNGGTSSSSSSSGGSGSSTGDVDRGDEDGSVDEDDEEDDEEESSPSRKGSRLRRDGSDAAACSSVVGSGAHGAALVAMLTSVSALLFERRRRRG